MKTGIAWKKTETEEDKRSRQQGMSEFEDHWYVNLPYPFCKIFCSRNAPVSGTNVGGMTPGRVKDRHYLMTDRPAETDISRNRKERSGQA